MERLANALPLGNGKRAWGGSSKKAEHKWRKQRLEKLDSTISELPQCFEELLKSLNGYCSAGLRLSALLGTVFEDTPLLLVSMRFKEASEQLEEKCKRLEIMLQPEFVSACKKIGPCVSHQRSCLDSHAKSLSKYESAQNALDAVNSSPSAPKQKLEQAEVKFRDALSDFAKEDTNLAHATDELDRLRVEAMGSCFLSMLEKQASLLNVAAEIMAPLGSYKEVGSVDSHSDSAVRDATLQWLSAAQVNRSLRTFGGLSRNDVQCMLYTGKEGLPETIRKGLNSKVDQLLKSYAAELEKTRGPPHIVPGGFHLNPKGIELALRDCCSELEAIGAGAPHVQSKEEKDAQIERDVPRMAFKIGSRLLRGATGSDVKDNIRQKLRAIEEEVARLPVTSQSLQNSTDKVNEFACHVLNESCTTVTNTAAKTTVQLVFGKANLVFVRPSPSSEDNKPVEISTKGDDSLLITVYSSWWLVEDYASFGSLGRMPQPDEYLGYVDTRFTYQMSILNHFSNEPSPEIPSIAVECRDANPDYSCTVQQPVGSSPSSWRAHGRMSSKNTRISSRKESGFHSFIPRDAGQQEDASAQRRFSSDSEGPDGEKDGHSDAGSRSSFSSSSSSTHNTEGLTIKGGDSLRRSGVTSSSSHTLLRYPSNESISTVTSSVTIKPSMDFESDDITDILPSVHGSRGELTQAKLMAANKHRYSHRRREPTRGEEKEPQQRSDKEKTRDPKTNTNSYNQATDDDFDQIFRYLSYNRDTPGQGPAGFSAAEYFWRKDGPQNEGGSNNSSGGLGTTSSFNPDGGEREEGNREEERRIKSHSMKENAVGSLDSGIGLLKGGKVERSMGGGGFSQGENGMVLDSIISSGFGHFDMNNFYPAPSSDSDSESLSGRGSSRGSTGVLHGSHGSQLDGLAFNMRTSSLDNIHQHHRSPSASSFHSLPAPPTDSTSLSLPEEHDFRPFDHAPGSHRGHFRHPSLSPDFNGEALSDQPPFSQVDPMAHPPPPPRGDPMDRDYHHLSSHYPSHDHQMMRGGGGHSQYHHYGSDPYPGPPPPYPPMMHDPRPPMKMHHRDDFSGLPPPPPPHPHSHPHPHHPSGSPGRPYWMEYNGPPGPPPPPPHHHPHPPPNRGHPHPPPNQYHHFTSYRANTPDGPSPAPSPHPTPPTTPPPSHHPQMMGMRMHGGPGPRPMPPPHGPGPGPHMVPPPPPMHPDFNYPMPPPPPHPSHMGPPRGGPHAPSPGPIPPGLWARHH